MEQSKLNSQERVLVIVEELVECQILGMTNKSLASETRTSEANVCRDLKILESRGWIEKAPDGRWRLTPKFGGFSGQIIKGFQVAKLRLTEDEARYASAMQ
ncbi:MAG: replication/maintenance protein RepL [Treponema sp.]|jgi:DNA-binding IclR family transcriptional regulator|nr:replication/maintenance protein RepL [Treponema sp.]